MAASYSYSVILEPQEGGGFTVLVPALPEVVTEGDTEQEALANVEEAIRAILEYRQEQRNETSVRCSSRNSPRNGGRLIWAADGFQSSTANVLSKCSRERVLSSIGLLGVITFLFIPAIRREQ